MEAMAVEQLVEAYWHIQGYWTRLRHPYKGTGWHDIDLLAFAPSTGHLVISESKARGQKNDVFAFTSVLTDRGKTFAGWEREQYLSFIHSLPAFFKDEFFIDLKKQVSTITVQLVSNYVFEPALKADAERSVRAMIDAQGGFPKKPAILLDSAFSIFCEVVKKERELDQGRRHGHPILDLARELNRYLHPSIKQAGNGKTAIDPLKSEMIRQIIDAFGLEDKVEVA